MATRTVDLGPVIGPQGPKGDAGQGVPAGGAAGQILVKVDATDFNSVWKSLIDAGIFKADGSVPMTGPIHWNGSFGPMGISTDGYSLIISGQNGSPDIVITDDGYIQMTAQVIELEGDVYARGLLDLDNNGIQRCEFVQTGSLRGPAEDEGILVDAPLLMDGHAIKELPDPLESGDASNKAYADTKLSLSGGNVDGDIHMGGYGLIAAAVSISSPDGLRGASINYEDNDTDGAAVLDLWGVYGDQEVRLKRLATPKVATDAANKGYVDQKTLVFTNKAVATSAWVSDSTYSAQGYNWAAVISCPGVMVSYRPDVAFGAADAVSGNFAPVSNSATDAVLVYCKTKPTLTVTIPSIVCVRGA